MAFRRRAIPEIVSLKFRYPDPAACGGRTRRAPQNLRSISPSSSKAQALPHKNHAGGVPACCARTTASSASVRCARTIAWPCRLWSGVFLRSQPGSDRTSDRVRLVQRRRIVEELQLPLGEAGFRQGIGREVQRRALAIATRRRTGRWSAEAFLRHEVRSERDVPRKAENLHVKQLLCHARCNATSATGFGSSTTKNGDRLPTRQRRPGAMGTRIAWRPAGQPRSPCRRPRGSAITAAARRTRPDLRGVLHRRRNQEFRWWHRRLSQERPGLPSTAGWAHATFVELLGISQTLVPACRTPTNMAVTWSATACAAQPGGRRRTHRRVSLPGRC